MNDSSVANRAETVKMFLPFAAAILDAILNISNYSRLSTIHHSTKKPVTAMLTYPWKCTVLHCNHLGNTWKPLVLMT